MSLEPHTCTRALPPPLGNDGDDDDDDSKTRAPATTPLSAAITLTSTVAASTLSAAHRQQLLACSKTNVAFFEVDPARWYWARVVHVYDGDTLWCAFDHMSGFLMDATAAAAAETMIGQNDDTLKLLHKWRVRVAGIDTAELKCAASRARAQEVRDHVAGLLMPQKNNDATIADSLVLVRPVKFEKYGRLLCHVYFCRQQQQHQQTWISLGHHLVEKGMAVAYHGGSKSDTPI